jgi:hypothetical protein
MRERDQEKVRAGVLAVLMVTASAAVTLAATVDVDWQPDPYPQSSSSAVQDGNTPYNGKFVFARLRHTERGGFGGGFRGRGYGYCNGPPWQHDYPCAEHSLMAIVSNATALKPGSETGNVIDVGDPELMRYPIAYLSHPDQWQMSDDEVKNIRAYLLKGGFIIFDDFPAGRSFGGGGGWGSFYQQMKAILPEYEAYALDATHPIFHSYFDFESLENLFGSEYGRNVAFYGYFEGNDPKKRLLAIVNYNNDLGENWEYVDQGFSLVPEAAGESFKFGVNYILYALTH